MVYSTRTIGGGEKVLNHFPLACMHLCVTLIWSSIFSLPTSVYWLTLLPFEALRIYRGQSHPHRSCFIRWNKLAIMQFLRCPFVSCSKAVEFRFLSDVSRETFLWIFCVRCYGCGPKLCASSREGISNPRRKLFCLFRTRKHSCLSLPGSAIKKEENSAQEVRKCRADIHFHRLWSASPQIINKKREVKVKHWLLLSWHEP